MFTTPFPPIQGFTEGCALCFESVYSIKKKINVWNPKSKTTKNSRFSLTRSSKWVHYILQVALATLSVDDTSLILMLLLVDMWAGFLDRTKA